MKSANSANHDPSVITLPVGRSPATLELSANLPLQFLLPRSEQRATISSADVTRWIQQPTESPRLMVSVTPDDRVVIALDVELPKPGMFIKPLLEELKQAGINSEQVTVLLSRETEFLGAIKSELQELSTDLTIAVHDSGPNGNRSYLASTEDGRRVYLNVLINDADLVITVGKARFDPLVGFHAAGSFLYPTLSDQEAQSMAQRIAVESKRSAKELRDRQGCDEVAWLLGTHFTLIAFPNEFGQIVDGCFGEQMAVVANTNQYLQEHHAIANRVSAGSLLIGTLRFSDRSVNWDDVGTALQSLSACAEPGTDLLLLTDLSEPPPIELQASIAESDRFSTWARHRERHSAGSLLILQIVPVLTKHKVYLFSKLPLDEVESAGMVGVTAVTEIEHLIRSRGKANCIEGADSVCLAPNRASASQMPAKPTTTKKTRKSSDRN